MEKRAATGESVGGSTRVNLKLSEGADRTSVLKRLRDEHGLTNVKRIFPREKLPDLARMYQAEIELDRLPRALHDAEADPSIEYLEEPAERKLIR